VSGSGLDWAERRRARTAALQLLYQHEVGGGSADELDEALQRYWDEHPVATRHRPFAVNLLRGAVNDREQVDPLISDASEHWRLSRMAVVDRSVLRLAVYELLLAETPAAVVIDEAIELARTFGDEASPRFVNGVLDAVKRTLEESPRSVPE